MSSDKVFCSVLEVQQIFSFFNFGPQSSIFKDNYIINDIVTLLCMFF